MPYIRKTMDEWQIHQYTGTQYGWEEVSAYDNRKDAKADLKIYQTEQPEYPARLVKRRIKINATA